MKRIFKILLIALVISLTFNSFAYSEETPAASPETTNEVSNTDNPENDIKPEKKFEIPAGDVLMAKVNEHEILASEVNDLFNFLLTQYSYSGADTQSYEASMQIYQMALDTAIQKYIVLQKAKELGLDTPNDEEMENIKKESQKLYDDTFNSLLEERVDKNASEEDKNNKTAEIKKEMEDASFTVDNIVKSNIEDYAIKNVQAYITKDIQVTDQEIEDKYQEKIADEKSLYDSNILYYEQAIMQNIPTWYTPEGYRGIKHILLKVDESLLSSYNSLKAELEEEGNIHNEGNELEENKEEKKEIKQEDLDAAKKKIMDSVESKVQEIKDKIENNVSFDDLVKEYGNDPGMNVEPYKTEGYRVNQNSFLYDPAFTKAAFTINSVGEYSEPIIGMYGVHILYYACDIRSGPVELNDSNKEIIKKEILGNKNSEAVDKTLNAWLNEFKIEKTEIK